MNDPDDFNIYFNESNDEDDIFSQQQIFGLFDDEDNIFVQQPKHPCQNESPNLSIVNAQFGEGPNNINILTLNNLFFRYLSEEQMGIQNTRGINDRPFRDERRRVPKRKVDLSKSALNFKNEFYAVFTKRKKFPKKYVKIIHNEYLAKQLHLNPMTRE